MDWGGPEAPEVPGVLGPGAPAPPPLGDDPGPGAPVPVGGGGGGGDAGVPVGALEGGLVGVEVGGLEAGGGGGDGGGGDDGELEGPRAAKAGQAVVLTVTEQSLGRAYTLVLFTVVLLLLSSPTAVHRQVGLLVLRLENTVQQAADGDASEPATYV